ncbi:MAG: SAM-dependent methyltransferase [Bdellovibrionota bacterium]
MLPAFQKLSEHKFMCAYIAPTGRVAELKDEIKKTIFEKDSFLLSDKPLRKSYWAQNIWQDIKVEKIESIKKAASFLESLQRNWWHYPLSNVRRTKLIQELLPRIKSRPLAFPFQIPQSPLGAFALLSENELIYSAKCQSFMPNGEFVFAEPKYKVPSEAYTKLWEALVRMGEWPQPGDFCVDLGSCPGSWTQALLKLGARVLSVDTAEIELDPTRDLEFLKKDAFKLNPAEIKNPSWICSDIICYPDKLYTLAVEWRKAHPKANFIFTLKFQGKWDRVTVDRFRQIPNSQVVHLFNNKHELCWMSGPKITQI